MRAEKEIKDKIMGLDSDMQKVIGQEAIGQDECIEMDAWVDALNWVLGEEE